jgi:carnitine O-acetyltransferase
VAEYTIVQGVDVDEFTEEKSTPPAGVDTSEPLWERLDWVGDEYIKREAAAATRRALEIVEDSDDSVMWFDDYGTEWIKTMAKMSPDAYVQMALQLAWYKTRGEFTATYETVLTRMFKNGRTETLRSYTGDARDWVLSMVTPGVSVSSLLPVCPWCFLLSAFLESKPPQGSSTCDPNPHSPDS